MRGWAISLAVLVAAAGLTSLSLTYGILYGSVFLGYPALAAAGSLGLFALAWVLDRRWTGTGALRALWLGLNIGGIIAMARFLTAVGEGSQ